MFPMSVIGLAAFLLIVLFGLLTLSEYSIVSSKRSRLKEWASRGNRGAEFALELGEEPERFLATVRLGTITVGVLTGFYGGTALIEAVSGFLGRFLASGPLRQALSYGLVAAGLIFGMYVFGEVLPRQIALSRPERVASRVARPMRFISLLTVPLERSLGAMIQFVLRNLGIHPTDEPSVTQEEIKVLLEEGTKAGVFEEAEQRLVQRVFRYSDRRAKAIMTHRDQIVWIEISDSAEEIRRKVMESPYSRFPVCDQSLDNLIGVVEAKDLLASNAIGGPLRVRGTLNIPIFLYEGTTGLRILETFRKASTPVAIVLNEYGSVVGILTPTDILKALVGDLSDREEEHIESGHGTGDARVLDGRLPLDEFAELFGLQEIPREDCDTLAGFVVARFGRIPKIGEHFAWNDLRFEVTRMVGNRVERVAVVAAPAVDSEAR